MEKTSVDRGSKPAVRFGFGFSWADEVEREEQRQQQQEEEGREAKKEQPTRADPFGAARPREVVLAEKGVDWRARDRELEAAAAARTRAAEAAASSRARTVTASACAASTPARRAPWEAGRAGQTPRPRRHAAAGLTPRAKDAPPSVSRSAWGSGKRKCDGDVPATATARRVRPVGDQGRRRVFGELNVGEGCGSTFRSATKKRCNTGGNETEGTKGSEASVVADGGASSGCRTMATAATVDELVRRGRGGIRGREEREDQGRQRTSKLCCSRYKH